MTIDELKAIPFHFVCSAAWETEHTMTYESEDGRLGYCDHTPKRKNGDFGKIQWSLGATIGRKFSKQFALNKQAQRVDYSAAQEPAVPSESGEDNGGGGETPGGELEG